MAISCDVNVGGSWERARKAHVKVSGTWRTVNTIYTRVAGVWETVYLAFFAGASPSSANSPIDGTATNNVTASGNGGLGPYSYLWTEVTPGLNVSLNGSPTSATVNWTVPTARDTAALWRCTVTDAYGDVDSVDVLVTFTSSV